MAFQFEEDEAIEFGDREAILIHNFRFWIRKNKANNHNFFDGRTWTWNKNDAFAKLFRFWSKDQVRRLIDSLVNQGVIIKGNYNSNSHDRTCWYAFTDEARFLREIPQTQDRPDLANLPNANGENAKCILENSQMDLAESKNPIGKTPKYITDNKPDIIPYSSSFKNIEEAKKFAEEEDLKIDVDYWWKISRANNIKNDKSAMIAWSKNPKNQVASKTETAESKEIIELRYQIRRALLDKGNDYDLYFRGCEIIENKIFVSNKKALKYEAELNKINVKIEVK